MEKKYTVDQRRKQDAENETLVSKDFNAFANMPPNPINKTFNANEYVERMSPCYGNDDEDS